MPSAPVFATGVGAVTCAGMGMEPFRQALLHAADFETRTTYADNAPAAPVCPLGLEDFQTSLDALPLSVKLRERIRRAGRRASRSVQASLLAAAEAWIRAGLEDSPAAPDRISLVVGGSNLCQREHALLAMAGARAKPTWAVQFLDTDHVGAVSEAFGIRGEGFTVGGSSASGNVALIHGMRALQGGVADVCLVIGAMTGLSAVEYGAFHAAGALACPGDEAERCNRPFDLQHRGFVHGEGAGCVILEVNGRRKDARIAHLASGAMQLDAHRSTDPSVEAEAAVMTRAIQAAGIRPDDVDYVNAHGTSSPKGDEVELAALDVVFADRAGEGVLVNSTKSVIGHTLCAAGVLESVAVLVQLEEGWVHATANLENPMPSAHRLVGERLAPPRLRHALSNSFGFGGVNTSLVWSKESA